MLRHGPDSIKTDGGWIKLHRRMLDSSVMADDWLCRLWIWCLLKANFNEKTSLGVTLQPGQFITCRRLAAAELHVTESRFYRGIQRLAAIGCIVIRTSRNRTSNPTKSEQAKTTITICNWQTYQNDSETSEHQNDAEANINRTSIEHQTEFSPYKELRREERKKAQAAPAEPVLPFTSERFSQAWEAWEQHHREIKKPIRPTSRKKQLDKLQELGEPRAIAMLEHSVEKGYHGLYEPNGNGKSNGNHPDVFSEMVDNCNEFIARGEQ